MCGVARSAEVIHRFFPDIPRMSAPRVNSGIVVAKFGEPVQFQDNLPIPQLGAKDVLVRITVRPVNPADLFSIAGVYPGFRPASLPAVPGLEGFGIVEEVGTDVAHFKKGDRVVPSLLDLPRSWQKYVVVSEENVFAVPDSVSDIAASQFIINPFTAWAMIYDVLKLKAGQTLLQSAAGSALGRMIISLAKRSGIKTINIVRRQEQVAELKAIGADHVIVSTDGKNVKEEVLAATNGKGADGAIDAVAGELTAHLTASVVSGAQVVVYGALSGISFTGSVIDALFRNVSVTGVWVTTWYPKQSQETKQRLVKELFEAYHLPGFGDHVGKTYPIEKANEAIAESAKYGRGGKIFLQD